MSSGLCENFVNFNQSLNNYDFNTGYSVMDFSRYCFIVIPCLGLVVNLFLIVTFLRKKKNEKESK